MKHLANTFFILLLIPATMLFSGCRKKKDTIAKIYVVDSVTHEPISGAEVKLYPVSTMEYPPNAMIDPKISSTNRSGEAIFHFNEEYQLGQAGVAVLNIKAVKDGEVANGIIKIEEETTSQETVSL